MFTAVAGPRRSKWFNQSESAARALIGIIREGLRNNPCPVESIRVFSSGRPAETKLLIQTLAKAESGLG
jgi:hypothetical protein